MIKFSNDPETLQRLKYRRLHGGSGSIGVMRSRSEKEKEIEHKMSTPITVKFKGTPLDDVVSQLHSMTGINFDLDLRRLKEENFDSKQPITTDLKDVSLKSALTIICSRAGLRHVIENETIRITTPKGASGRQVVKSLSVGDLVVPAPNYGATPGLSLTESLNMAQDSAYGLLRSATATTRRGRRRAPCPTALARAVRRSSPRRRATCETSTRRWTAAPARTPGRRTEPSSAS